MNGLHENIAQYTHSGSKPCNMAASGEFVLGISFEYRGNSNKAKGALIDLVFPKEGLGWTSVRDPLREPRSFDAAKKFRRLGGQQGRHGALRQEFRDHRCAGHGAAAAERRRTTNRVW